MYSIRYSLSKTKVIYLALAIWVHITLLDLFCITLQGPSFFWAESIELKTLLTHLFITLITVIAYFFLHHARLSLQETLQFNNKVLVIFLAATLVLAILIVVI